MQYTYSRKAEFFIKSNVLGVHEIPSYNSLLLFNAVHLPQKGRALNIGQRTPWTAIKITWTIPVSVASQECAVELDPIFCINIKTVREKTG